MSVNQSTGKDEVRAKIEVCVGIWMRESPGQQGEFPVAKEERERRGRREEEDLEHRIVEKRRKWRGSGDI